MSDNLHNANDLIEELEGAAIRTSQGTFVKMEDVRRLIEKRNAAGAIEDKAEPTPKTMTEAKEQAKKFLAEAAKKSGLPVPVPNIGKAVPASEPQPPSRA
jgi:hypothetical protein